jgi:hypothetical protein
MIEVRAADDGTDTKYYDVNCTLGGREYGIDWQYVTAHQFSGRRIHSLAPKRRDE